MFTTVARCASESALSPGDVHYILCGKCFCLIEFLESETLFLVCLQVVRYILDRNACLLPAYFVINEVLSIKK